MLPPRGDSQRDALAVDDGKRATQTTGQFPVGKPTEQFDFGALPLTFRTVGLVGYEGRDFQGLPLETDLMSPPAQLASQLQISHGAEQLDFAGGPRRYGCVGTIFRQLIRSFHRRP